MEVDDKFQSKATGDQSLSSSVHNSPCENRTSDHTAWKLLLLKTNVNKELRTCFNQEKKQTHVSKRSRMAKRKENGKIPRSQVPRKDSSSCLSIQPCRRKKRKAENPGRLFFDSDNSTPPFGDLQSRNCENSECNAVMCSGDTFCWECSCCICHLFDENRDSSLWLKCSSNSGEEESCGRFCHIACALQNEKAGVVDLGLLTELDGSYCCPHCGNVSDIIWLWKQQLDIAKDAARLDVMCQRILLGYRLLEGTLRHKELHGIVRDLKEKIEEEVGMSCSSISTNLGDVNHRLNAKQRNQTVGTPEANLTCHLKFNPIELNAPFNSVGIPPDYVGVRRICALAVERADELLATTSNESSKFKVCRLISEETTPSSILTILLKPASSSAVGGYKLWCRRTLDEAPSADPACVFAPTHTRILISGLRPSTLYTVSVLPFSEAGGDLPGRSRAEFSTLKSSPSSALRLPPGFRIRDLRDGRRPEGEGEEAGAPAAAKCLPDLNDPAPCETARESGSSVGGGGGGRAGEGRGWLDQGFEQCVRVVRGLEKGGSITSGFRMKLLTWLGLWSTEPERRVVKTFMRALADDPASMAGQLTHLFSSVVSSRKEG